MRRKHQPGCPCCTVAEYVVPCLNRPLPAGLNWSTVEGEAFEGGGQLRAIGPGHYAYDDRVGNAEPLGRVFWFWDGIIQIASAYAWAPSGADDCDPAPGSYRMGFWLACGDFGFGLSAYAAWRVGARANCRRTTGSYVPKSDECDAPGATGDCRISGNYTRESQVLSPKLSLAFGKVNTSGNRWLEFPQPTIVVNEP